MQRREAFKRWLQNERIKKSGKAIPEHVINQYVRSIHKLSDAMYENGLIPKRLYSITDVEELDSVITQIKKERIYLTMNQESENLVHKALDYYSKYIQHLNALKNK